MNNTVEPHPAAEQLDEFLFINGGLVKVCAMAKLEKSAVIDALSIAFYAGFKAGEQKFLQHTGRPPGK